MQEFVTGSREETIGLGKRLGGSLKKGDIVAIEGELGAGKTTFITGLAEGLGVKDFVVSPTFIIINEYSGRLPFFHMDLYRVEDPSSMEDLAATEYFDRGGVVAIEWAERLGALLPERYLSVKIESVDENTRRIMVEEREGKG